MAYSSLVGFIKYNFFHAHQLSISDLLRRRITRITVNACSDDFTNVSVRFHGSLSAYVYASDTVVCIHHFLSSSLHNRKLGSYM